MTNLDQWASISTKMDETLFRQALGLSYTLAKICTLIGLCRLKSIRCTCSTNLSLALHRQDIKNRVLEIYGSRFNKRTLNHDIVVKHCFFVWACQKCLCLHDGMLTWRMIQRYGNIVVVIHYASMEIMDKFLKILLKNW